MGYYTSYELHVSIDPNNEAINTDELIAEVERMNAFDERYSGRTDNDLCWCAPEAKWSCWETDMLKLSSLFPDMVFELSGDGDAVDDFWRAYFKGGMEQWAPGEIVYDDFSPSKLKEPDNPVDIHAPYSNEP